MGYDALEFATFLQELNMYRFLAVSLLVSLLVGCNSTATSNSENTETTKAAANYETVPNNQISKIKAHKFKEDHVTEGPISNFDIVWDKSEPTTNDRHVQLVKKNSSPPIYTDCHMNWGKVLEQYPAD